jgi:DNA-binding IclR family transcriptional regulator
MSDHVEQVVLPKLLEIGRGRTLRTAVIADLVGYSQRRMYDFFVELERFGLLVRKPGGKVWRLA